MVQPTRDFQTRRLERACRHVEDLWFPVNDALLKEIQTNLQTETYASVEALVDEIRGDFSLFAYCIKELLQMLKDDEVTPPDNNPMTLFRAAGLERLKAILAVEETDISRHSLSRLTPL